MWLYCDCYVVICCIYYGYIVVRLLLYCVEKGIKWCEQGVQNVF
jgi:hypothetical protein